MNKSIYQMSTVGQCPRALAARKLGYDPLPRTEEDELRLKHYSRMEAVAAEQIMNMGYELEVGGLCEKCGRNGIHIELDTALFLLVGHLDRRLILNGKKFPVEIKSAGKSSWIKFRKEQFLGFPGYTGQECAYLETEKQPGIYWVTDRDSGDSLKYIVNDFNNELNLTGFEKITLPITFVEIEDKLNQIEILAQDGLLSEGVVSEDCWWCNYKYLCIKEEKDKEATKLETSSTLLEAAKNYQEAKQLEQVASELKQEATQTFLTHSKTNKIDKYKVANVSFTYRGQKTKESIDTKTLKTELPDIYEKYKRESKPFDDFSIRLLNEGD